MTLADLLDDMQEWTTGDVVLVAVPEDVYGAMCEATLLLVEWRQVLVDWRQLGASELGASESGGRVVADRRLRTDSAITRLLALCAGPHSSEEEA